MLLHHFQEESARKFPQKIALIHKGEQLTYEDIDAKEVENAIYGLEGVVEVAVIPVPDDNLGQVIKALIAAGNEYHLTERDVLKHCKKELEEFEIPKYIDFRDSLPKTSSAKIDKLSVKQSEGGGQRSEAIRMLNCTVKYPLYPLCLAP